MFPFITEIDNIIKHREMLCNKNVKTHFGLKVYHLTQRVFLNNWKNIEKKKWQIMNVVITRLLGLCVILEVCVHSWTILSKEKENLLKKW